ncbi:MAG: hypothetical protein JJE15_03985 [Desulfobacteraceae bacterium]|nr:hypothetical protein [Desulfobacteraceae bacterium]
MKAREAIITFSQSEKIKAGLIWISHALVLLQGPHEFERQGSEKTIKALIGMVVQEIQIARKMARDPAWDEVEKNIDQALVMINSNVGPESVSHLTKALSQVTGISHRSMSFLKDQGLL